MPNYVLVSLSGTIFLWVAVVLARPRRVAGAEWRELAYSRVAAGWERLVIAAVIATAVCFCLGLYAIHPPAVTPPSPCVTRWQWAGTGYVKVCD